MKQRLNKLLAIVLTASLCVPMLPAGTVRAAGSGVTFTEEVVTSVSELGSERVTLFNDGWKFFLGDSDDAPKKEFNDAAWQSIDLPHDYSIFQEFTASGEAESGHLPGGTGWYRKTFELPESCKGKTLVLNFDGVYSEAYVYVNGEKIGENHYGYTPFSFDISNYVTCDGRTENVIAVKSVNQIPSSRWYSGSGIYRDVNLIITEPVHVGVDGTAVTTPKIADNDGTVNIKVDVVNDGDSTAEVTVKNTVYDSDDKAVSGAGSTTVTVEAGKTVTAEGTTSVSNPKLWSVDNPNLYYVRTELSVNGEVTDTYDSRFGFRWYSFNDTTGFSLNGEKIKLNGVCMHHDQGALGSAAYYDAMYRQLASMKEMGANAIRITHNPGDKRFVEICDEMGLIVIEEFFDCWSRSKNGNSFDFARYFNTKLTGDNQVLGGTTSMTWAEFTLKSTVKRDRNNPSVILWSLANELKEAGVSADYLTIVEDLITWVKEEDTTRQVTIGDNDRGENATLDQVCAKVKERGGIVGYNYANSSQLANLSQKYGCILASETSSAVNSRGIYTTQGNQENADGKYHLTSYDTSTVGWGKTAYQSMWDTLTVDYVAGEFVWTGFDYIGEPTPWNGTGSGAGINGAQPTYPNSSYFGIVETTGFEKDTYYLYRSQWNQDASTLHLVTAWDADNMLTTNGKTPVVVYSNAPVVKLYRNGTQIGTATRKVNTTQAGHKYYTYTTSSDNSSVCQAVSASNGQSLYATFNVAYEAGTISARAFQEDGTTEIPASEIGGSTSVSTPGSVTKLVASVDKTEINADGSSLAYITVDVKDAKDVLDTTAINEINFSLTGNGKILGVDNGDQATVDKYQQPSVLKSSSEAKIKAYAGKALVIVCSTQTAGNFTVTASSDGLESASVEVTTKATGNTTEKQIANYRMSKYCYIPVGTKELVLPSTAVVTYTDGTTQSLSVKWEAYDKANLAKAGIFRINGSISDGTEEINVFLTAQVYNPVASAENYSCITRPGVAPVLPSTLMTYSDDGDKFRTFPVNWDMKGITEGDFATVGTIVKIPGVVSALGKTFQVTASIRVAEPISAGQINIMDQANLEQCLLQNGQMVPMGSNQCSDNLNSIKDGIRYNIQADNNTNGRWTNYNTRALNAKNVITMTWATVHIVDELRLYYYIEPDNANSQYPTSIEFQYTSDGDTWKNIGHIEKELEDVDSPVATEKALNGRSYTFTESIEPLEIRVIFGHDQGKFVGLSEAEVFQPSYTYEENTSANLDGVTVGGVNVKFDDAKTEYVINAPSLDNIVASNAANAAVTVVKVSETEAKLVVVSEDGKTTKTYTVKLQKSVNEENQRKELSKQLAAVKAIDSSLYTPESYAKLQSVIASIEKAMATANEAELKALMSQLTAAQNALVKVSNLTPPPTLTPAIKAGDKATVNKMEFKVLDANAKTVALTKGKNKKATTVKVPDTVKVNGETCKVVQIGKNAFKGYAKLKSVTIGKNVTTIESKAFYGCKKLSKVTFKGTAVKKIKSGAFKKTSSKMTVKVPKSLKKNKKTFAKFKKSLTKAGISKKAKIK